MQLVPSPIRKSILAAALIACSALYTLADEVNVKTSFYHQTDGGGIEEVDEDASVFETIVFYKKELSDTDSIGVRLLADIFTAASVERAHNPEYRALQSGASGDKVVGGTLSWQHQFEDWAFDSNASFSKEYSYSSAGLGFGATVPVNDGNTTIGAHFQAYLDTVGMIRFNGVEESDEDRNTYTGNIDVTQIISPTSLVNVTYSHTEQDGFLATQFNSVFINGVEDFEVLPDARSRDSITVRYKQAFGKDASWEVGLREYIDDWGINAQTLDLRWSQYMNNRSWLLEPTYRLHTQGEADDYQESFTAKEEFQTSDPDLGDFLGHMVGAKATFFDRHFLWIDGDWDAGIYYYTRDNGLDMIWASFGYRMEF
jgi:hypothetical protein